MAYKKRILLIEDDEDIAALIKLKAELFGYKLHVEVDGINGLRAVEREKPDLVLLDIMLPGQNGFDVCRRMKNSPQLKNIPIILLSDKQEEVDEILGLELGADDYIRKPLSMRLLFARIKAVLRRGVLKSKKAKNISFGEFILEIEKFTLKKDKKAVPLTLSEFGILKRLATNPGRVLTRLELLDDVNNDDSLIVDRNIDVHIAALRKKLGEKSAYIETVRGVGYRFLEVEA